MTMARAERASRDRFPGQAEARMASFEYIERWHHPHRRYSDLGYRLPLDFERSYQQAA